MLLQQQEQDVSVQLLLQHQLQQLQVAAAAGVSVGGHVCIVWVYVQYAEYSSAAAEENNFSCLSEYWLLGLQTQHSLDGLLVSLQVC